MRETRVFCPSNRYEYDFGLCSFQKDFAQIDTSQDAHYFGIWANPKRLMVFTYCEGDCILREADTVEEFRQELERMKAWYEEAGHKFYGIDCGMKEHLRVAFIDAGLENLLH